MLAVSGGVLPIGAESEPEVACTDAHAFPDGPGVVVKSEERALLMNISLN